jgi:hypothetical protein
MRWLSLNIYIYIYIYIYIQTAKINTVFLIILINRITRACSLIYSLLDLGVGIFLNKTTHQHSQIYISITFSFNFIHETQFHLCTNAMHLYKTEIDSSGPFAFKQCLKSQLLDLEINLFHTILFIALKHGHYQNSAPTLDLPPKATVLSLGPYLLT